MKCPLCQKEMPDNAKFCGGCGHRIAPSPGAKVDAVKVNTPPVKPVMPVAQQNVAQKKAEKPKSAGKGVVIAMMILLLLFVLGSLGYIAYECGLFDTLFVQEEDHDDRDRDKKKDKDSDGKKDLFGKKEAVTEPAATEPQPETTAPTQPTEAEPVYEYRYEIVKSDMSWEDANAACQAKGGYLATIDSPQEYETICRLADQSGLTYLWMGARLPADSNQWKWSTGEDIPLENYYWYRKGSLVEPSYMDKSDGAREDCLCLWKLSSGGYSWTLNDQRNNLVQEFSEVAGHVGYICEYKVEVKP